MSKENHCIAYSAVI